MRSRVSAGGVCQNLSSLVAEASLTNDCSRSDALSQWQLVLQASVFLLFVYRVSQEECARFRESVPYVKLYRYN